MTARGRSWIRKILLYSGLAVALMTASASGSETSAPLKGEPVDTISFKADDPSRWVPVNDGVMGGMSRSSLVRTEAGTGLFSGVLSLENNGGFASVRTDLGRLDLSADDGLEIRVRGDGRAYQLRLRTDDRFDGAAYRAGFQTVEGEWITLWIPFSEFVPTFRGRILRDAPSLDRSQLRQMAFMVADKQPGPFRLEIEYVRARAGDS